MKGEFRMTVEMHPARYVLNRAACELLLANLDEFGEECGDPCKRLRADLRKALAVDAAARSAANVQQETQEAEVTEELTVKLVAEDVAEDVAEPTSDDGAVRCAWCDEEGQRVNDDGDKTLYVCRTEGCPRRGRPQERKAFETLYGRGDQ